MRIFNRKKDKEETKLNELTDLIKEQNKTIKELNQQTKELEDCNKTIINKLNQQETIITSLEKQVGNINKIEKQITNLQEENTQLKNNQIKIKENIQKSLDKLTKTEPQTKTESKKHLYEIRNNLKKPYINPKLQGENLTNGRGLFSFTITDIIKIKEKLQEYHNTNTPISKIGEIHNIHHETIYRVIWNIEEGTFDNLIIEYQTNKHNIKKDTHIRKIGKSYHNKYTNIKMSKGNVYVNKNKKLKYTIKEIVELKRRIPLTKEYSSIKKLFKSMQFSDYLSKTLIWNIEEGVFDDIIKEYEKENNHIRNIPLSLRREQTKLALMENGKISNNGKILKYNMEDVLSLKDKIEDIDNYPTVKSIHESMSSNLSRMIVSTLIWNIEEGNYDKLINTYNKHLEDSQKYHIYTISPSYQIKLKKLTVDNEGCIHNTINQKLSYTIYDIMEMKKRIYSGKVSKISELYEDLGYSHQLGHKLVWNIEEGTFDSLIEEFTSRNYDYEMRNNHLYIDGVDTKLTIEKCNIIIDCIINEPNKPITINRLIRTYGDINPKYIRIIGEEYNNKNLSKILRKKVKKIVKVNNPQKRKEIGYI